jgi:protease IV
VTRQRKWCIIALCLLPIAIGLVVVTIDAAGGGSALAMGRKVGLVRIDDAILGSEDVIEQLDAYAKDDGIAAVVVRLNSPGGAVAPSQEIYEAIIRFKESGKPIVASMDNVAASGAYYVASAADRIFANPGTLTGSIGVIMRLSHFYQLYGKIGVDVETITAGKYKDIGSPNRKMTVEERRFLEQLVQNIYQQFVHDVAKGRSMPLDSVERYAKGQVFTGTQAVEAKLVDTLGGLFDAVKYVKHATGLPEGAKLYEKRSRAPLWWDFFESKLMGGTHLMERMLYPSGIYYLYEPG